MQEVELSQEQLACAEKALDPSNRLFAITGAAGTGKTTLIRHLSQKLGNLVTVAAPTGKAAKRIREATGLNAITIHKLLEYGKPGERDPKTGEPTDVTTPKRDKFNPLSAQVLLIDEYSMVTHELNRNLIDALPPGGRIIMFGDISQLPPVESYQIKNANGSPFKSHLARPGCSFTLTRIFRQGEGNDILTAAQAIRAGQMPRVGERFKRVFTDDPLKRLKDFVFEMQDKGVDFRSIRNQILSPTKKRFIGTAALNVILRELLNDNREDEMSLMRFKWEEDLNVSVSVGDKVVCTENTYDMRNYTERFTDWDENGNPDLDSFIPTPETKMMLNGETGIITVLEPDGTIEVDFGDRTVEIPAVYEEWWAKQSKFIETYPQRQIDLAYALTVHKAQGSEYDHVAYLMNRSLSWMLSREHYYTAVTRARESVTVFTDMQSQATALRMTEEVRMKRAAQQAEKKGKLVQK